MVLPAGVNHDALNNYVADKHVAHTGVTITAGAGLIGGGDISASRTLDIGAGTGIAVNANDVAVDQSFSPTWTGPHTFSGTEPRTKFNETDQAADEKLWDFDVQTKTFSLRTRTDADGAGVDVLKILRGTGTAFSLMLFGLDSDPTGDTAAPRRYKFGPANVTGNNTVEVFALDGSAQCSFIRYNGSLVSSPTDIVNGNILSQINFRGYDTNTAAPQSGVSIVCTATGNWSGSERGAKLAFNTTAPGTTASTATLTLSGPSAVFDAVVRLKGYTVATLPAGTVGDTAYVTDALAPVFLGAVAGGGAITCTVFYNGANWVVQ